MNRLCRALIARAVPPAEREWVLGDIDEEYGEIERRLGRMAARQWLAAETVRVALNPWRLRRRASVEPIPSRGASRMHTLLRDTAFAAIAKRYEPITPRRAQGRPRF